jgi:hypothetical protein
MKNIFETTTQLLTKQRVIKKSQGFQKKGYQCEEEKYV